MPPQPLAVCYPCVRYITSIVVNTRVSISTWKDCDEALMYNNIIKYNVRAYVCVRYMGIYVAIIIIISIDIKILFVSSAPIVVVVTRVGSRQCIYIYILYDMTILWVCDAPSKQTTFTPSSPAATSWLAWCRRVILWWCYSHTCRFC